MYLDSKYWCLVNVTSVLKVYYDSDTYFSVVVDYTDRNLFAKILHSSSTRKYIRSGEDCVSELPDNLILKSDQDRE